MPISKDDHQVHLSETTPCSLCAEEVHLRSLRHELHNTTNLKWIEVAILEVELKIGNTVKDENENLMTMYFVAYPDQGCICADEKDLPDWTSPLHSRPNRARRLGPGRSQAGIKWPGKTMTGSAAVLPV
jgi:hypothetical protein